MIEAMKGALVAAFVTGVLWSHASIAKAEEKIALLVGVDSYRYEFSVLDAACNDVALLGRFLTREGFRVETLCDPDIRELERASSRFVLAHRNAEPGSKFVYHFSGHGFRLDGQDFVTAVDSRGANLIGSSFALIPFFRSLSGREDVVTLVTIDACRNNLYSPPTESAIGPFPQQDIDGLVIGYGTHAGGVSAGSPYGYYSVGLWYGLAGVDNWSLVRSLQSAGRITQEYTRTSANPDGRQQPVIVPAAENILACLIRCGAEVDRIPPIDFDTRIYFNWDSSEITAEGLMVAELAIGRSYRWAEHLTQAAGKSGWIELVGYEPLGGEDASESVDIASRRIEAVQAQLTSAGLAQDRIYSRVSDASDRLDARTVRVAIRYGRRPNS
jgi:hypothetical protein